MMFIVYFVIVTHTGLTLDGGKRLVSISSPAACMEWGRAQAAKIKVPAGYTVQHECREMT